MDWEAIKQLRNDMGSTIQDYQYLYKLVQELKLKKVLDIGTCTGISAITMALAMKDAGTDGIVVTIDINKDFMKIMSDQATEMGVKDMISFIIGDSVHVIDKYLLDASFDLAFLDGEHTYNKLKTEYNMLKDCCRYILFHDLQIEEVKRFIQENILKDDIIELREHGETGQQWSMGKVVYESFPGTALVKGGLC